MSAMASSSYSALGQTHASLTSPAQDSDGESAASSAKSAISSAASSISSHEVTFHNQLSDVVNLFSGWHDCEQSIALLVLLRKTNLVQWRYLYHQIETRLSTATDLIHKEECANNPVFLRSLDSRSDEDLVSALLTHLPLLRPGNEEAKSVLLNLLEKAFKSNVDGGIRLLECRRILTFALLHPAMNLEDRRNLQTWLPRIEEKITSDVKLAHDKMLAHNDILNSAIDISSPNTFSNHHHSMIKSAQRNSWDLSMCPTGNGGPVNGGYNLVNGLSGQNQDIQTLMRTAISLVTQKPGNMNGSAGANFDMMSSSSMSASTRSFPGGNNNPHFMSQYSSSLSKSQRQRNNNHNSALRSATTFNDKSRFPNANQKPMNQCSTNTFSNGRPIPTHKGSMFADRNGNDRCASLAFPMDSTSNHHASLPSKASSLNNGSTPSLSQLAYSSVDQWQRSSISLVDKERRAQTNGNSNGNGNGNCISFPSAGFQQTNQNPLGSRQSSYGYQSSNHGGSSSVDQYTNQGTFAIPGSGMREVPSWLKSLRLHKYCSLFAKLSYEEMFELTEEKLEAEQVTKGARHKIVLNLQKLKQRQSVLQALEKDLITEPSLANVSSALTELKNMLNTPIKAFKPTLPSRPSSSSSSSAGSQDPTSGDIGEGSTINADRNGNDQPNEGDLPEEITILLEQVYKCMAENGHRAYDLITNYKITSQRCLMHEAFTESQKARISQCLNNLQNYAHTNGSRRNTGPSSNMSPADHINHNFNPVPPTSTTYKTGSSDLRDLTSQLKTFTLNSNVVNGNSLATSTSSWSPLFSSFPTPFQPT